MIDVTVNNRQYEGSIICPACIDVCWVSYVYIDFVIKFTVHCCFIRTIQTVLALNVKLIRSKSLIIVISRVNYIRNYAFLLSSQNDKLIGSLDFARTYLDMQ